MAALRFVNVFEKAISGMKVNEIAKRTKHATEFGGGVF